MLTLGSSREALARALPALLMDERAGLHTLLRLALQRYSEHGFGDATVLAPLIELAYCGAVELDRNDRRGRESTRTQIRELVLVWLRGLVKLDAPPLVLRQRVREQVLRAKPTTYDRFAIEALAMLGPDLDERAQQFLRSVAADHSGANLAPAVESVGAVLALSAHQPDLLLALAEAFYILPSGRERHGPFLDRGIRNHEKAGGLGTPMAAWYYGPFCRLLQARPLETIALINRMLDHAAAVRVATLGALRVDDEVRDVAEFRLDLDLPGCGMRRCVGDAHVWSWYRGSSVGPYACMSALLALERFADELVNADTQLSRLTEILLRDCHNLAMPGLVVGLLVRHLERAGGMLDPWLARAELWHLEFSRAGAEGRLHVQGPDSPDMLGQERRRFSFREVAAEMVLRAMREGDTDRLAALAAVGNALLRHARERLRGRGNNDQEMLLVESWAATLRSENYHVRQTDDGGCLAQYQPPEGIASRSLSTTVRQWVSEFSVAPPPSSLVRRPRSRSRLEAA